jgi:short-subunit dehydrogenase
MNIRGKNVIITGASSGIGREVLSLLLEEQCHILAAARNIDKIGISHPNLHLYKCDVSTSDGVDSLFEQAVKDLGTIDLFYANAGFAYYENLENPDWEHIRKIYGTNFESVVYSAEKMKLLHGKTPYNFVVTASGMSFLPLPGYALYSSTKTALKGFADAYRWELERGQHIQLVYPIATRTNFFKQAGDSPVPWPSQDSKTVAKSVVRGIKANRKGIFPSKLFYITIVVGKFLPFVNKLYCKAQKRKFDEWVLSRNTGGQQDGK